MSAIGMLIYNWFPKWRKMFRLHDDVIKWKHFPRNWPFLRGIHRSPGNSPHKGQWRGALMISLICVWINDWVNNRKAGDLRRYRGHYDVIVMYTIHMQQFNHTWDNKNASFQSYLCGKGCYNVISLQWRHNGCDGVSNHQPHGCLSIVYWDADQREHESSVPLAFVWGIHRLPVNSPHKWPVTRKIFPSDDVILQCSFIPRRPYVQSVWIH